MRRFLEHLDCYRALHISLRLLWGGFVAGLAGCASGLVACAIAAGRPAHMLAELLIAGGFAAMLAGWTFGLRYVICPGCGQPLYEFPQLPWTIPDSCPHCGKKLPPPEN